jgi:hypothetical protein
MKNIFESAEVSSPKHWSLTIDGLVGGVSYTEVELPYPILAKRSFRSRGVGMKKIDNRQDFITFMQTYVINKTVQERNPYYLEKFHNYSREYRLHISEFGCFYACRKALKKDIPTEEKWHFHDSTCVWFLESNENFYKPNSWNDIIIDCVKALKAIGADILSFDVKVQSPKNKDGNLRPYQEYILLECNSASSMGDYDGKPSICAEKYINVIPRIILNKIKNG